EACALVGKTAKKKFDETVDVAIRLGVDPKHADQMVRGAVVLPHGIGKTVRVAVFAKGDKAREAQEAGADGVGEGDLAATTQGGSKGVGQTVMSGAKGVAGLLGGPGGRGPPPWGRRGRGRTGERGVRAPSEIERGTWDVTRSRKWSALSTT